MAAHALGWLAVALYAGAEVLAIVSLVSPRKALERAPAVAIGAGLVFHFFDLMSRARAIGTVPYGTLGGSVSLFGWMLGIAYLFLLVRHRERAIGPFLIPFVLAASALGMALPDAASAPSRGTHGSLFAFHVTFGILAYAAFTFSFVLSILYLIQNRQIRRRQTGLLFARLPALELIGRMNRTSVRVGLAVLALSLAFGLAWARRVWGTLADPKLEWAVATLAIYAFLLWMDRRGWAGPRVAVLSIVGFGVLLFSYSVVNIYFTHAHSFR